MKEFKNLIDKNHAIDVAEQLNLDQECDWRYKAVAVEGNKQNLYTIEVYDEDNIFLGYI